VICLTSSRTVEPPNLDIKHAVWIIACCAVAASAVVNDSRDDGWVGQSSHLIPRLLAAPAICALLVRAKLAFATFAVALDMYHMAFLPTLVISALSLCLAFVGSLWGGALP